ncbi:MAG: hypothetical protein IPO53_10300 [Chitinophagaceae bacterium]|nr:hypothetical protein [Chitinophagaceae bacterium]
MKNSLVTWLALTLFSISSCTVMGTLYPVSKDKNDFIFKKEILGKWGDPKEPNDFYVADTVAGNEGKLYLFQAVYSDKVDKKADTNWFNAHLLLIGNSYFLDCWLNMEKDLLENHHSHKDFLIPRHFIISVSFPADNRLMMNVPDPDEIIKLVDQKKLHLTYAKLKADDYLLLDQPAVLHKELAASIKYPQLYKESTVLQKLE